MSPSFNAFQKKLEEAIAAARAVAVCIGPHGLGRWQEVEYFSVYQRFIEREAPGGVVGAGGAEAIFSAGVRVIPVLLPGAKQEHVPLFARQLNHIDLRPADDAKRRQEMHKLVKAVLSATADR